jgi:hypothetical protein
MPLLLSRYKLCKIPIPNVFFFLTSNASTKSSFREFLYAIAEAYSFKISHLPLKRKGIKEPVNEGLML